VKIKTYEFLKFNLWGINLIYIFEMDGTLSLQLSKDADIDWAPGVWE
jgi:hypothetical protein